MTPITSPNGARKRILMALAKNGMQTTEELAGETRLTARQVRANCAAVRFEGLLVNVRDDVTHLLAYRLTEAGKARISAGLAGESPEHDCGAAADATMTDQIAIPDPDDPETATTIPATNEAIHSEQEIVVTDAPTAPEQYAICRSGQAHLSAWPLYDMPIEAARQIAIDDAIATNGEVVLYRCTPIGRAFMSVVFEDQ